MKNTTSDKSASDADPNAVSIETANELINQRLPTLSGTETLPLMQCRGRYLETPLLSPMHSPPFRSSAMDGFAFRAADGGDERIVVGESFAGHPSVDTLQPGECVRITTGARVPDDADMVVQQENVSIIRATSQSTTCTAGQSTPKLGTGTGTGTGTGSETNTTPDTTIVIEKQPDKIGHHIRAIGTDCQQDACIAKAGTRVNAGLIGLCSALGIQALTVKRQVRITLVSTGDELKHPSETLASGQIYDSNSHLLAALYDDPCFDITVGKRMLDNPQSVNDSLNQAMESSDFVITTGGVSVGAKDHLREVVEARGGVDLWKVAMKPGRPLSFGVLDGKTPWFGLPGNPVSAALTSLLFVLPAIKHCQGITNNPMRSLRVRCLDELTKLPGRVEFQRGQLSTTDDGEMVVSTTGLQDSHVLSSLANANCFIRLSVESDGVRVGGMVDVLPYEFVRSTL